MDTPGQPPPSPDDAGQRLMWLPMAEAVRQLGISERTIRRRLAARTMNARRVGKVTLVAVSGDDLAAAGVATARPALSGAGEDVAENASQTAYIGLQRQELAEVVSQAVRAALEAPDGILARRNRELTEELARAREAAAMWQERTAQLALPAPRRPWWAIWRRR